MERYITKIVPVDSLQSNMLTAEDIFTNVGQMLITANTSLDEKHIKKLRLYGIHDIPIKHTIDDPNVTRFQYSPPKKLIKASEQFKVFESFYQDHNVSLKNQMLDISEGKHIDISGLFSISSDLLTTIKNKSDLFNFLTNLQNFDDYTYSHCLNVSLICYIIGQWLGFNNEKLIHLSVSGLLHDIGKNKIDKNILNKPGKLTDEEFEEMKQHTIYGFRIIEKQNIPYNIKMAVLMHHERYDGNGYPLGASNHQINDFAKIVAIADIYDALTSDRPYRHKYSPFHVIRQFEQEYLGHLDTRFLMLFLQNIAYCYLGSWCRLSTGEEGKIVFINKRLPSKPIIQVDNTILDLSQEVNIHIEEII